MVTLLNSFATSNHLLVNDSFISNFLYFSKLFIFSGLTALAKLFNSGLPRCDNRIHFSLILNFKENASCSFTFRVVSILNS